MSDNIEQIPLSGRKSRRNIAIIVIAIIAVAAVAGIIGLQYIPSQNSSTKIQIVAGENFWGSLVSQLGGTQVQVVSIVSDPNTDPHEYEANSTTAKAIANAQYVIVNGVGYDDWALQLISADNNQNQKILNVGNLVGVPIGGNPHMWYSPTLVNQTVHQMYTDLVVLDPANTTYFQQQYINLNASLGIYNGWINKISQQFNGTEVAATEDIFVYLANATKLDLISPPEFMQAVAEGNDPPTASVVEFQNQLESGNVKVMAYNNQTITPLTTNMQTLAIQYNVTIVGISETVQPPTLSFQDWMTYETMTLYNALNATVQGH